MRLDMKVLKMDCPQCGFPLRLPEAYATAQTTEEVDEMRKIWNEVVYRISEVCAGMDGDDPHLELLIKLLKSIKKRLLVPDLKLLAGGKVADKP